MPEYYRIKSMNLLGKREGMFDFSVLRPAGWEPDADHLFMDRLMGYEAADGIGCTDTLADVEPVSEEEALRIVGRKGA